MTVKQKESLPRLKVPGARISIIAPGEYKIPLCIEGYGPYLIGVTAQFPRDLHQSDIPHPRGSVSITNNQILAVWTECSAFS